MKFIAVLFAFLSIAPEICQAVQCSEPGYVHIAKANTEDSYIFYPTRIYGDSAFVLPGKSIDTKPGMDAGKNRFFIDDVFYEFVSVSSKKFQQLAARNADVDILKRHFKWERDFIIANSKSSKKIFEVEEIPREEYGSTPQLRFKLWYHAEDEKISTTRQYYFVTVFGDEVFALSSIVTGSAQIDRMMAAFKRYYNSLIFIPSKEKCPGNQ
jgi:hypothetical protein